MKPIQLVCCILICLPLSLLAQKNVSGIEVDKKITKSLSSHFSKYSLFKINTAQVKTYIKDAGTTISAVDLNLTGFGTFKLLLQENDILSPGYQLTVASPAGKQVFAKPACITYAGVLAGESNSRVRLTITSDLIYGHIKTNDKDYFIEPLNYFVSNTNPGIFVVYETGDAIIDPLQTCGVTETAAAQQKLSQTEKVAAGLTCVRTEVAIASDDSMLVRYGSAVAVATHNIGVMNNVIWNYTNAAFNNNIEFVIAAQYVATSAEDNPLLPVYSGTNSSTILSNFRAWGQAGNFGVNYDIGQLWTTRNIDSDGAGTNAGIVGLAYLGTVCTLNRYHILQDFTGLNTAGSGFSLEVLTVHETGHNFNCVHDAAGSPFIMAPAVNNTRLWSSASISAVDAFVATRNCLAQCSSSGSLVADFIASPSTICIGGSIQFLDRSIGGPTSWKWSFTRGTPITSTLRNPTISFASAGIKNIVLVTNNGNGAVVKAAQVIVSSPPAAAACVNTGEGTTNAGINSFSLGNINKVTGGVAADGDKYLDFACTDNTILAAGTNYSARANVGTNNPANSFNLVQFFIDYNNDGDFADANEAVYSSPQCYIGNHTFSFNTIANPPVLNQLLRARLIAKDCVTGINACVNPTAGQVEDYGVLFLGPEPACNFNYWSGANNKAWENPMNWSCGIIPNSTTNVIIGSGKPNYPEINSMAFCKSLFNTSGTSVIVTTGFKLEIVGNN